MSLEKKIQDFAGSWAKLLSDDLKVSVDRALKDGGSERPQHDINFKEFVKVDGSKVSIIIESTDYWDYIESGVDGTKVKHGSPYSFKGKYINVGSVKNWIDRASIDARKIITEINIKRKGGLSLTPKQLRKAKKGLSVSEAENRLSFIFARSIARDGLEPKPFVDRVLNEDRIAVLVEGLGEIIGTEIVAEINGTEFKNIKVQI